MYFYAITKATTLNIPVSKADMVIVYIKHFSFYSLISGYDLYYYFYQITDISYVLLEKRSPLLSWLYFLSIITQKN